MPVNVIARLRPSTTPKTCIQPTSPSTLLYTGANTQHSFTFHAVYPDTTTNAQLFTEQVLPLLPSTLTAKGKGGNHKECVIFAYGCTGSGKSYTMNGESVRAVTEEAKREKGVVEMVVEQLLTPGK